MLELIFVVEQVDQGYVARAVGASIFAEADDVSALYARVRDAVRCHFGPRRGPDVIRLHFVRDEVIAAAPGRAPDSPETPDAHGRWALRPVVSAAEAGVDARRRPTTRRRAGPGAPRDQRR